MLALLDATILFSLGHLASGMIWIPAYIIGLILYGQKGHSILKYLGLGGATLIGWGITLMWLLFLPANVTGRSVDDIGPTVVLTLGLGIGAVVAQWFVFFMMVRTPRQES